MPKGTYQLYVKMTVEGWVDVEGISYENARRNFEQTYPRMESIYRMLDPMVFNVEVDLENSHKYLEGVGVGEPTIEYPYEKED